MLYAPAFACHRHIPLDSTHLDIRASFSPSNNSTSATSTHGLQHISDSNNHRNRSFTSNGAPGNVSKDCAVDCTTDAALAGSCYPVAVVLAEAREQGGQRARIAYDFGSCELQVTVTGGPAQAAADRTLGCRLEGLRPGKLFLGSPIIAALAYLATMLCCCLEEMSEICSVHDLLVGRQLRTLNPECDQLSFFLFCKVCCQRQLPPLLEKHAVRPN